MRLLENLCLLSFLFLTLFFATTHAVRFDVGNNCPYTVWATTVPGGGRQLNPGETWPLDVAGGMTGACIWARTGCNFDDARRGGCQTGDCGGALQCRAYGKPPNTLAKSTLNQYNNLDFFDISLVDGFNVPMEFSPTSGGYRGIWCTVDINGQCPNDIAFDLD